jgi:hypothetical protein
MQQVQACYQQFLALFSNGETRCAAIAIAVCAFILGILITCILCKICHGCGCKGSSKKECSCGKGATSSMRRPTFERRFEKTHPAPADGSIEIYVGNLSYDLTEDQLGKEFAAYGKVNSARIITNHYNNRSKGYGFVHMPDRAEAEAAIKALNDKEILGRKLKCNEARNVVSEG